MFSNPTYDLYPPCTFRTLASFASVGVITIRMREDGPSRPPSEMLLEMMIGNFFVWMPRECCCSVEASHKRRLPALRAELSGLTTGVNMPSEMTFPIYIFGEGDCIALLRPDDIGSGLEHYDVADKVYSGYDCDGMTAQILKRNMTSLWNDCIPTWRVSTTAVTTKSMIPL